MHPLHEQLKDEHGEAEGVVLGAAVDLREARPLQLRRCVLRLADPAAKHALRRAHLKRIGIHNRNQCLRRDQHVGFVEIADDVAALVQSGDRGGEIPRGAQQIDIVKLGAVLQPRARRVVFDDEPGPIDPRHEVADKLTFTIDEPRSRPGDGRVPRLRHGIVGRRGEHRRQLRGTLRRRAMVDLGAQVGYAVHAEDQCLATPAERLLVQGPRDITAFLPYLHRRVSDRTCAGFLRILCRHLKTRADAGTSRSGEPSRTRPGQGGMPHSCP
jgi:hypothetical protein